MQLGHHFMFVVPVVTLLIGRRISCGTQLDLFSFECLHFLCCYEYWFGGRFCRIISFVLHADYSENKKHSLVCMYVRLTTWMALSDTDHLSPFLYTSMIIGLPHDILYNLVDYTMSSKQRKHIINLQRKYRISSNRRFYSWWRHQMETFSALLVICAGNSSVTGEFHAQRPVTRSFDVFVFDLRLNLTPGS